MDINVLTPAQLAESNLISFCLILHLVTNPCLQSPDTHDIRFLQAAVQVMPQDDATSLVDARCIQNMGPPTASINSTHHLTKLKCASNFNASPSSTKLPFPSLLFAMTAGFNIVIWIRFSETGRTDVLTDDCRSPRLGLGLTPT